MNSSDTATAMSFKYVVSGGNETLQAFDFIAQVVDELTDRDYIDSMLLCELIKIHASSRAFKDNRAGQQLIESEQL